MPLGELHLVRVTWGTLVTDDELGIGGGCPEGMGTQPLSLCAENGASVSGPLI